MMIFLGQNWSHWSANPVCKNARGTNTGFASTLTQHLYAISQALFLARSPRINGGQTARVSLSHQFQVQRDPARDSREWFPLSRQSWSRRPSHSSDCLNALNCFRRPDLGVSHLPRRAFASTCGIALSVSAHSKPRFTFSSMYKWY